MRWNWFLGMVVCLLVACPALAVADTIAAGVTVDYGLPRTFTDSTMGYRFTAREDASVVALGVWDHGGGGLLENHDVGLWTDDGSTLLASIAVYAGGSSYLSEGFRWRDLATAVAIEEGKTYRVGAYYDSTNYDRVASTRLTTISKDSRISYDGWARTSSAHGLLAFLDSTGVGGYYTSHFLGGNVRLGGALSAVPEPASVGLLALGLIGFGVARVRRRAREQTSIPRT